MNELYTLKSQMAKASTPLIVDLVERYNIEEKHLITGIPCNECSHFPLRRLRRKWICNSCGKVNPDESHVRAILDFFLLHSKTLSNQDCREFLQLDSADITYHLLKTMQLKTKGKNKSRMYLSPPLCAFPQNDSPMEFNRSIFG